MLKNPRSRHMFDQKTVIVIKDVLDQARESGFMIATAESCTGGLIATALTSVAGSSDIFERGFVTYSNQAKVEMLGVDEDLITLHGAVSQQVARAMCEGAIEHSNANLAVSVTGIAGPGGGSKEKPVGTVHIGVTSQEAGTNHAHLDFGDIGRAEIRLKTMLAAFSMLQAQMADHIASA
jgi:nicotinamide-nucleotide amidase